VKSKVKTANQT